MQVWAEAVPEAPEPQGCAAPLKNTDVQQGQPGRPGHSGQPKSAAPQSQHEKQPGHESAPTKPQSPTRELPRDNIADGSQLAAAAPHPLLSVAQPVSQTPEPASSASSASLHPLMQVLAGPHVQPVPDSKCLPLIASRRFSYAWVSGSLRLAQVGHASTESLQGGADSRVALGSHHGSEGSLQAASDDPGACGDGAALDAASAISVSTSGEE